MLYILRRNDLITGTSGRFQARSVENRDVPPHIADDVTSLKIMSCDRDTRATHTQTLGNDVLRNAEVVRLETVLRCQ